MSSSIALLVLVLTVYLKLTHNDLNYVCMADHGGPKAEINRKYATLPQKYFFNINMMIVMQQISVVLFVLVKSHRKNRKSEADRKASLEKKRDTLLSSKSNLELENIAS